MQTDKTDAFFVRKKKLLKQCLNLSEEFISNLDQWESLEGILKRREGVLQQLKSNEETYGKEVAASCSQAQKEEIDRLINLIVSLDNDATAKIRENQKLTINSIKTNIHAQKLLNYGSIPVSNSGKLLNKRK